MRKRITCMLLAMLMIISLIPVGTVRVFAADHTYSDNLVAFIKSWEGFSATAFWDVSQYSIGYGTQGVQGQTITEAEADTALRNALTKIDTKVNEFAARTGLNFTQGQHDALVSLSFNCGTDWMKGPGRLHSAIVNRVDGNAFLYAICLWANVNGVPDRGLILRRLSEANLYFNGTYSKAVPGNYTYVILNPNGGVAGMGGEDKMQGYTTSISTDFLAANPSKSGYTFGGWYTEPTGGNYVGTLDASVAAKTLYAQYGYQVKVTGSYVNVRSKADAGSALLGTRNFGDSLVIVQTQKAGDRLWGRFSGGWVALDYTDFATVAGTNTDIGNGTENGSAVATGTVKCSTYVNVRKDAGTGNPVVGSISNGTNVTIYETKTVGTEKWGRISSGWISLAFVSLNSSESEESGDSVWDDEEPSASDSDDSAWNDSDKGENDSSSDTDAKTDDYTEGTVTGNGVNVRQAAGVGNKIITTKNKGAAVKVYEKVTKDNASWGRIDEGWICLNYVALKSSSGDSGTGTTESVIATGTVNTNTNLNVRSGAGTNYASVKYLTGGTKVSIYEKKTVGGQDWGRIDEKNWICLSYVKLDNASGGSTSVVLATGVVNANTGLNVRNGAGTNYTKLRTLNPGTKISIYEKTTVSGQEWGRIDANSWICLSYVKLDSSASGSTATTGTGKVISKSGLNVRSAAGTNNAIVGAYASGETVTITETTTVGTAKWGRTAKGWVCMDYIQITNNAAASASGNSTSMPQQAPSTIWS